MFGDKAFFFWFLSYKLPLPSCAGLQDRIDRADRGSATHPDLPFNGPQTCSKAHYDYTCKLDVDVNCLLIRQF